MHVCKVCSSRMKMHTAGRVCAGYSDVPRVAPEGHGLGQCWQMTQGRHSLLLIAVGELAGHGVELWQLLAGLADSRFEPALGKAHFILCSWFQPCTHGVLCRS